MTETPPRASDTAFGPGIPLGRYGGVPVSAHWSVLVIVFLLTEILAVTVLPDAAPGHPKLAYLGVALAGAIVFLATLLAHELAHALLARHYGMPVKRITLWMLGGMTELGGDSPSPRADALIALVGPVTSLGLGGVFVLLEWLAGWGGLLGSALGWLAAVNILLGAFNLLPGAPLDGGRVLRAVLWRHYRDRIRAVDVTARVGRVLGIALVALGLLEVLAGYFAGLWLALVGWFIMSGAASERYTVLVDQLRGLHVRDVMDTPVTIAPGWLTVADWVDQLAPEQLRHPLFPVIGFSGQLEGVLTAQDLGRVRPEERAAVRIRDVGRRSLATLTVAPDAPLTDVAAPLRLRGVAVVLDGTQIVGTVTEADLLRAGNLARLRQHSDRSAV